MASDLPLPDTPHRAAAPASDTPGLAAAPTNGALHATSMPASDVPAEAVAEEGAWHVAAAGGRAETARGGADGPAPARWMLVGGLAVLAVMAAGAGAAWVAQGTVLTYAFIACCWGCAAGAWLVRRAFATATRGISIEVPASVAPLPPPDVGLEHVPFAVFTAHADGTLDPSNMAARRLLAPGGMAHGGALAAQISALLPGERKLLECDTERGRERALASAASLVVAGRPEKLVALLPVENELQAESLAAWEQLVHVLTHEIMNSLTPVASLSLTLRRLLQDAPLHADLATDVDTSLDAIARRAENLTRFVSGYRQLASVPEAAPQHVRLADLFARLDALAAPAWRARYGQATFDVDPPTLEMHADQGQLEQALVNLLRNAEEACAGQASPQVHVSARLARGGRLRIEVTDNGPGVADDVVADIFTPFVSTKGSGRGTGLALVRQLVRRNGGTIRYVRSVQPGARFVLTF